MKIYLRTLTPVHVGTGEDLVSLDYVIIGDRYYRISQKQFSRFLKNNRALIPLYSNWVLQVSKDLQELTNRKTLRGQPLQGMDYNQTRTQLHRDFNLLVFCREHNKETEFRSFMESEPGIVSYPVHGELKQEVREQIRTGLTSYPYIPGSSIKGAIRTALLYYMLMHEGNQYKQMFIKDIKQYLGNRKLWKSKLSKQIGRSLERMPAYCGVRKLDSKGKPSDRVTYEDEKQDLFKFLFISDGLPNQSTESMAVVTADLYLVNQVKKAKDETPDYIATRQPQAPSMEVIQKDQMFGFEIDFRIEELFHIYETMKLQEIRGEQRVEWIGLEDKVYDLFGLDLQNLRKEELQQKKQEVVDYIFSALTYFSRAQIEFESEWLQEQMLKRPMDDQISLSKKSFSQAFDRIYGFEYGRTTLIRAGFGTGFSNSTLLMYMLQDSDLRIQLENVMKRLEIGKKPKTRDSQGFTPDLEKFPKSRILISYADRVSPLGWMEWIPESVHSSLASS